ncbi:MAG: serine hydrolase [Pyrinomonadaceae bacterium]
MTRKILYLFFTLSISVFAVFAINAAAQQNRPPDVSLQQKTAVSANAASQPPRALQQLVDEAAHAALQSFAGKKLQEKNLAITLVDLSDAQHPAQASFRGAEGIYPASVVKLFYLVAAHRQMEDGKIKDTPELRRAMRDMIVDSSNDATHYVLDELTGTTSGPELPPAEMAEWIFKRNAVNRYFAAQGYTGINANQKPWCEGPYGRDRVFVGAKYDNRNKLTTDATARLLTEIVTGRAITPARSTQMMELLKRDFAGKSTDADDQAHGFTGIALQSGARLWSKAGWTSATRHDAAYIELPNGARFILVTFTTDHANDRDIIPTVARAIINGIGNIR